MIQYQNSSQWNTEACGSIQKIEKSLIRNVNIHHSLILADSYF